MDRPAPDPKKILAYWMEWERGETPPGRVISNLKNAGFRDLIEAIVTAAETTAPADSADAGTAAAAAS